MPSEKSKTKKNSKQQEDTAPTLAERLYKGHQEAKKCGATTRGGTPCGNIPSRGRTTCRFHGGTGPIGIASPHYKTGKSSKFLPDRLVSQFKNSMVDKNLLELRYEISLVDAHIVELTAELDKKGNTEHFRDVKTAVRKLKQDIANGDDPDALILALDSIEYSLRAGIKNSTVWKDLGDQIDRRQRLAESERKRLIDGHHMISAERMMMLVAGILKIILENVPDMQARHRIRSSLQTLLPSQTLTVKTKRSHTDGVEWLRSGKEPNADSKEKCTVSRS